MIDNSNRAEYRALMQQGCNVKVLLIYPQIGYDIPETRDYNGSLFDMLDD